MLWMLIVKKLYAQSYGEFEHSYAAKLKKGVIKNDTDIVRGIDFISNRCFEPYFKCYTKWRNKALDVAKESCKNDNILMVSLDLKSFYYSVDFDFKLLSKLFIENERYSEISFFDQFCSSNIRKIYFFYFKI